MMQGNDGVLAAKGTLSSANNVWHIQVAGSPYSREEPLHNCWQ